MKEGINEGTEVGMRERRKEGKIEGMKEEMN